MCLREKLKVIKIERFKKAKAPVDAINQYLKEIYIEASHRK